MDGQANTEPLDLVIDVATPEHVAFRYRIAGPFQRLIAYGLDLLVRVGIYSVVVMLVGYFAASLGQFGQGVSGIWFGWLILFWFVLSWFYGAVLETYMNGQTLGKRWTGLRVMSVDGCAIDGGQAVLRNLLRAADLLPLLALGSSVDEPGLLVPLGTVGLFCAACTRRFQRLGDWVAGTMVVHEERVELPQVAWADDTDVQYCLLLIPEDLRVTRTLVRALASYVARRNELSPERRNELAEHLAKVLKQRWGLTAEVKDDALLRALYLRALGAATPQRFRQPAALASEQLT